MNRLSPIGRLKLGKLLGFMCIQDHAAASSGCGRWRHSSGVNELVRALSCTADCRAHHRSDQAAIPGPSRTVFTPGWAQTVPWLKHDSRLLDCDRTRLIVPGPLALQFPRHYTTQSNKQPGDTDQSEKNLTKESIESKDSRVEEVVEEPKGILQRFKEAYKEYGKVLVCVHLATSSVWFGSFYYAAYSGIDVMPILKSLGASERVIAMFQKAGVGNIAVAYLLYKLATPARYTVTIGGTHWLVRVLRQRGYIEAVPEGDRIRDLVRDSRDHVQTKVKDKYGDLKDEMKDNIGEWKDKVKSKRT